MADVPFPNAFADEVTEIAKTDPRLVLLWPAQVATTPHWWLVWLCAGRPGRSGKKRDTRGELKSLLCTFHK